MSSPEEDAPGAAEAVADVQDALLHPRLRDAAARPETAQNNNTAPIEDVWYYIWSSFIRFKMHFVVTKDIYSGFGIIFVIPNRGGL